MSGSINFFNIYQRLYSSLILRVNRAAISWVSSQIEIYFNIQPQNLLRFQTSPPRSKHDLQLRSRVWSGLHTLFLCSLQHPEEPCPHPTWWTSPPLSHRYQHPSSQCPAIFTLSRSEGTDHKLASLCTFVCNQTEALHRWNAGHVNGDNFVVSLHTFNWTPPSSRDRTPTTECSTLHSLRKQPWEIIESLTCTNRKDTR